jgi:hypothetical protein
VLPPTLIPSRPKTVDMIISSALTVAGTVLDFHQIPY